MDLVVDGRDVSAPVEQDGGVEDEAVLARQDGEHDVGAVLARGGAELRDRWSVQALGHRVLLRRAVQPQRRDHLRQADGVWPVMRRTLDQLQLGLAVRCDRVLHRPLRPTASTSHRRDARIPCHLAFSLARGDGTFWRLRVKRAPPGRVSATRCRVVAPAACWRARWRARPARCPTIGPWPYSWRNSARRPPSRSTPPRGRGERRSPGRGRGPSGCAWPPPGAGRGERGPAAPPGRAPGCRPGRPAPAVRGHRSPEAGHGGPPVGRRARAPGTLRGLARRPTRR